jgi:uncharacterized membrane protein YfcA
MTVSLDPLTKGAFGGGFAILGIPFLALVMDPIAAGAVLAPLFVLSDLFALRYWRPASWSRPDLIGSLKLPREAEVPGWRCSSKMLAAFKQA